MKEVFRQIVSTALALMVLLSTMSFSLDMDYCGDHLVDYSIFDSVDDCMMKAESSKSSSECGIMAMDMDCCSDVEVSFEGQDNLKVSFDHNYFDQKIFIASFTYTYINLFEGTESEKVPFVDYPPPFIKRDVQVLHQSFLI